MVMVERVKGIEPSYAAWEAAVLPLNYTREAGIVRHWLQYRGPRKMHGADPFLRQVLGCSPVTHAETPGRRHVDAISSKTFVLRHAPDARRLPEALPRASAETVDHAWKTAFNLLPQNGWTRIRY